MTEFVVEISGSPVPVAVGSVSISGNLGSRVVCSFEVVETLPFDDPVVVGSEITIQNGAGDLIFGGTVDSVAESVAPSRNVRYQRISGVDYSQIADRFLVGYAYQPTSVLLPTDETYTTNQKLAHTIAVDGTTIVITTGTTRGSTRATYPTALDLTNVNYVSVVWMSQNVDFPVSTPPTGVGLYVVASTSATGGYDTYDARADETMASIWGGKTTYLDVSALSGDHYIRVHSYKRSDTPAVDQAQATITQIGTDVPVASNTAGEIVKDIVDRFFIYNDASENINYTGVENGSLIEKAVFNYLPASECFDELAELLGWIWYIDFEKKLFFTPRDRFSAPFSITDTTGQWRNLSIERTREQYRNRQYIRGGEAWTNPRSTSFVASSGQTIFETPYDIASGLSVMNGGAAATLGVAGYDDDLGYDFYWSYGSPLLEYRGVADISGNVVMFSYQGLFPILVRQDLDSEIAARAVIEGGTGLYEGIADEPQINDQATAETKALAYLRKYGVVPDIVRFETRLPGLRPGMLIDINVPLFGIDDEFLIQSMRIRDDGGALTWYSIEAVSGDALGGWLDFFTALSRQAQKFVLFPEERVTVGEEMDETILVSDAVIMSDSGMPESRTDLARTDFSELDWVHV